MKFVSVALTKNQLPKIIVAGIALIAAGLMWLPSHASAISPGLWQAGNIISDPIFANNQAMSVNQIQQFLNAKVGTCDTNGTQTFTAPNGQTMTHAEWGKQNGHNPPYTCINEYAENPSNGQNNYTDASPSKVNALNPSSLPSGWESAAQIIYNSAQKYDINPEVIIVTMQKEQGLITDNWPWIYEYQEAMGAGCPDTAPCDTKEAGFYNQIDAGTGDFRYYLNNNSQFNYHIGNNQILYNPSTSCGSSNVNIQNLSTAALYIYTPYQPNQAALNAGYGTGNSCSSYGNRNFWLYFNDWFGPSTANFLLKGSGAGIYLVDGSTKHLFPSSAMLAAYGLQKTHITPTSDSYLASLSSGAPMTNVFTIGSGSEVYLVDNGQSHGIASSTYCTNWGLNCGSAVALSSNMASLFPSGSILKPLMDLNGSVFLMDNGKRELFLSWTALIQHGYTSSSITTINSTINRSQPVGISYPQNNSLVTYKTSPVFFYYTNNQYYAINSRDAYLSWFEPTDHVFVDDISSYNQSLPTLAGNMSTFVSYDGHYYVVDQNRKLDVTNLGSNWPLSSAVDGSAFSSQLASLPTITLSATTPLQFPGGAIFIVSNKQLRVVQSMTDFYRLGYKASDVIHVLKTTLPSLNKGPNLISVGRVVQSSTGTIYITQPNESAYALPNMSAFKAFHLSTADVPQLDPTTLNAYTNTASKLTYLTKDSSGNEFIITTDGYKIPADSNLLAKWGISASSFITLDSQTLNNIPTSSNSASFAAYNGAIYEGGGGQRHLITSYSKYLDLGGKTSNTINVNQDFIEASPVGASE